MGVVPAGVEPNEKREEEEEEAVVVDVVLLVGDLKVKGGGPKVDGVVAAEEAPNEKVLAVGLVEVFSPKLNPVEDGVVAVDEVTGADGASKKFKLGFVVSGFDSDVLDLSSESVFPNENVGFFSATPVVASTGVNLN